MDSAPASAGPSSTIKFPAFSPDYDPRYSSEDAYRNKDDLSLSNDGSPVVGSAGDPNGRWAARRPSGRVGWSDVNASSYNDRHARQKSLSEAIRNIRARRASIGQNALEIADALKVPVSPRLVYLFVIWYFSSVMSSTASRSVLITFPKPVTLTIVQFLLVSGWCIFLNRLAHSFPVLKRLLPVLKHGLVKPSWEVFRTTLPLTFFMIFGHITSSDAISRIDVSLVHTIKGLSPLITVAAYRFIFRVNYEMSTYLSLMPLTIGVFLACSSNFRANFIGIFMAFLSAVIFVTQNIVSKSIFNEAAVAEADPTLKKKPDKLSLLCYSSLIAFVFTAPIWFWSEGWQMLVDLLSKGSITLSGKQGSLTHRGLLHQYLLNGSFHFLQSLTAFVLLSLVTPVTYSVASLIKRVFVIVFSILWWRSPMTPVQGVGIALTFLGLYLYDRSGNTAKLADRRGQPLARPLPQGLAILGSSALSSSAAANGSSMPLLPVAERASPLPPHLVAFPRRPSRPPLFGGAPPRSEPQLHSPPVENGEGRSNGWLPSGTKAEETWSARDVGVKVS